MNTNNFTKAKRTEAEKTAYRAKRKQDIVEAIGRAKTFEDTP